MQDRDQRGTGAHEPEGGRGAEEGVGHSGRASPAISPASLRARNLATLLLEALLEDEAEEIGRKTIELAKEGDSRALKACLDRLVPPPRDRFVAFSLPPLETAADLPKASAALLAAVAEGEVTPSEAAELARLVETHAKAIEVNELEKRRVAELEERLDE